MLINVSTALSMDNLIVNPNIEDIIDIYKMEDIQGVDLIIELKFEENNYDLAVLTSNNIYSVQYALSRNINPITNPHLINLSNAEGSLDEIISMRSSYEILFLVVFSLEELAGDATFDHDYQLNANVPYTGEVFTHTWGNQKTGHIFENGDNILDENEYHFFQFNILKGDILDISFELELRSSGRIEIVLSLANNAEELLEDLEAIAEATDALPEGVYAHDLASKIEGEQLRVQISLAFSESMVLNLWFLSNDISNPFEMNYKMDTSVETDPNPVTINKSIDYTSILFGLLILCFLGFYLIVDSNRRRKKVETAELKVTTLQPQNAPPISFTVISQDNNIDQQTNFCEICGNQLRTVKTFCPSCGSKIRKVQDDS
ncbi:MAG: zinc ribbon domain-containing protein [Candidatus Heimdallarchaeota archaeon]|nr:zinc ribbon domain-containing protein [Candidatus Heimdallarchaeota archaeon]